MDPPDMGTSRVSPTRRLASWKEIAIYFGRSVSTVRRWEKSEGLPIHRHQHADGSSIHAYPHELDAWLAARVGGESGLAAASVNGMRPWRWVAAAALGITLVAVTSWRVNRARTVHAGFEDVRSALLAAEEGREVRPSLSPDGTLVAYAWKEADGEGPYRLYVRPVPGGPSRRLTQSLGRDDFPNWSRDGKKLLFTRHWGTRVEVRVHELQTGREEKLLELPDAGRAESLQTRWAGWGPDGHSLAVIKPSRVDGPLALYLVSRDGGGWRQITFPGDGENGDRDFAFSPDGRQLAVVRERRGLESDIYLIRLGERKAARLTRELGMVHGLTFAPGGESLLLAAPRLSAVHTLWRLWPDGRFEVVPGLLGESSWPSASFARKRLQVAYTRSSLPVNLHVWRAPFAGKPQPLLPSGLTEASAALSPDGRMLAFRSNRGGPMQIWTVNLDGSNLRRVTNLEAVNIDSPRWSPDGKRLVFTAGRGDQRQAYVIDLGSGELRELADPGGSRMRASWSPDGRWIFFTSRRTGRFEIWKAPLDGGGAPVQVTRGGGVEAFPSADGTTVYFTKERPTLGVYQVSVNGGQERLVVEGAREGLWAVGRAAIWYARLDPLGLIERYRFDTKRVERVGQIPEVHDLRTGFTVSADGSTVAWCQGMDEVEDIAMVEWAR